MLFNIVKKMPYFCFLCISNKPGRGLVRFRAYISVVIPAQLQIRPGAAAI